MLKFRKRGHHSTKIEELSADHFTLGKPAYHGFPSNPTAIGFDPEFQLLAIGTKTGEFRVYGQPSVVFYAQTKSGSPISHIYTFHGLHMFITVSEDNTITLWELSSEGSLSVSPTQEFKLDPEGGKKITACCLSKNRGHFYIGTEGGNIFILDVRSFQLSSDVIYWNSATALIQPGPKSHPGVIKCLELCPTDHNKLLVGYEKGVVVLWDVEGGMPIKNFPASIQDCQQVGHTSVDSIQIPPLESVSWQKEGLKFVSAHSDSSILFWSASNSSPHEGPTLYYDQQGIKGVSGCQPVTKINWLNTDANPLLVFTGGLPTDQEGDHHTVTVIQGADHVALDFTSPVVDYITIVDPSTNRGSAIIVLCEQEIIAFDLRAPKCPQIRKPYLFTLNASPVTSLKLYENCSKDLYVALQELSITSPPPHEFFSFMEWPAMGGSVRASEPTVFDILVTGHENGMIKFWDVTTGAMRLIYELKTANLFVGQEPEVDLDDFADFKWPPYRKVSAYDPFEDDPRLAIKFIEFCPFSKTLCVGGNGGQVITFSLNPIPNDVRLESARAEIFVGEEPQRGRGGLHKRMPLECKTDLISLPAGFQASFCLQCIPASSITALAFQPSWGIVAAGNSKGFAVANFLVKRGILVHPTVRADGVEARSVSRMQSFRRSIRSSIRRRRSTTRTTDDRKKIAQSLNIEAGIQDKKSPRKPREAGQGFRGRATSEPVHSTMDANMALSEEGQVPPELAGYVTNLAFAETHVFSGGRASAAVFATTMGSVVIRYHLSLPPLEDRLYQANRAFSVGKDYSLLHAAPIVAVFLLDHDGVPIPNPYEVEQRATVAPNMHTPHYAVVITQEQIKIVSLPGMRQKRKEKFTSEQTPDRIAKAWVLRVKVAAVPMGAPRDWNPALALLTNRGNIIFYSLPDLRLCTVVDEYISTSDHKALQSASISLNGEIFHLRSFSELERSLLCSYGFSYHTTLLPSLFPFEGSTQVPHSGSGSFGERQIVQADVNAETPPRRSSEGSNLSPPRSDAVTVTVDMVESCSLEGTRSRRSQTPSPEDTKMGKVEKEKPEIVHPVPAKANGVLDHAQGYVEAVDANETTAEKQKSPPPVSGGDRDLIASAQAFTQMQKQRRGSESSTSSSGSSSSSVSSSSDEALPEGQQDMTFGNPFALGLDELGDGSKELDNIIASSLQQLQSARAFYEQMQAQAKKSE